MPVSDLSPRELGRVLTNLADGSGIENEDVIRRAGIALERDDALGLYEICAANGLCFEIRSVLDSLIARFELHLLRDHTVIGITRGTDLSTLLAQGRRMVNERVLAAA